MPAEKLLEPLAAFLGPGAMAVLLLGIALFRWWTSYSSADATNLAAQRAALSAEQAALFKQMREELEDARKQLREEREAHRVTALDRDRGWMKLRAMDRYAHWMRHRVAGWLQIAFAAGHYHQDLPDFPLNVPSMETVENWQPPPELKPLALPPGTEPD
jgi:hypothetical protein